MTIIKDLRYRLRGWNVRHLEPYFLGELALGLVNGYRFCCVWEYAKLRRRGILPGRAWRLGSPETYMRHSKSTHVLCSRCRELPS